VEWFSCRPKQAEDSAVIELRSEGSLAPLDEESLEASRELCRELSGHLVVWSETNKRIRLVNLPFSSPEKPERKLPVKVDSTSVLEGQGKSILLVDDEDAIRAVERRLSLAPAIPSIWLRMVSRGWRSTNRKRTRSTLFSSTW
jgi:hypothetical protein